MCCTYTCLETLGSKWNENFVETLWRMWNINTRLEYIFNGLSLNTVHLYPYVSID